MLRTNQFQQRQSAGERRQTTRLMFGAFGLTMLLYFIATALSGQNAFLGGSILSNDLSQQYLSLFAYYRKVWQGQATIGYSFSSGLGGSMAGDWAYYLLSPFNLILLLFPQAQLPLGLYVVIMLKLGSASLAFTYMARRCYPQLQALQLWSLAVAYSLMGFVVVYYLHLLWLDALICLPLIVWGLRRLTWDGSPLTYLFWLAAALITNYYMGFMLCIFSVLMFLYFGLLDWAKIQRKLRVIVNFVGASILAGGLAAFVLIPTWQNLTGGKFKLTETHLSTERLGSWQFFSKFVVGNNSNHYPNLFIGTFALLLFILFFLNQRIGWREKLITLGLTLLLGSGLMFEPIYLLWHGFQPPISFPYRFAYLLSFWLLFVAARAWQAGLEPLTRWQGFTLVGLGVVYTGYFFWRRHNFSAISATRLAWGLCVLLAGVALLFWLQKRQPTWAYAGILVLTCLDLGLNMVLIQRTVHTDSGTVYRQYATELGDEIDQIKADAGNQTQFYRIDKNFMRAHDRGDAYQHSYHGASLYTSNIAAVVPEFYQKLGLPGFGYTVAYTNGTKLTDALLGIRYFIDDPQTQSQSKTGVDYYGVRTDLTSEPIIAKNGTRVTYRNDQALGLGFAAAGIAALPTTTASAPLANQNRLFQELTGSQEQPLSLLKRSSLRLRNLTATTASGVTTLTKERAGAAASLTTSYQGLPAETSYYLSVDQHFRPSVSDFYVNGKKIDFFPVAVQPLVLGVKPVNGRITIKIKLKTDQLNYRALDLARFEANVFAQGWQRLQQRQWQLSEFSDTKVVGTITTTAAQPNFLTTIPTVKGWQAQVDGQTVPLQTGLGTFIALKLKPGRHRITLTYQVPGLRRGLWVSLLSLLLVLAWWGWRYWRSRQTAHRNLLGH
ncbi:YfhO family protein [Lapidilactobacillus salsurivasis]